MKINNITKPIKPVIKNLSNKAKNISDEKITEGLLWGVPAAIIPFSRKKIDKDRTNGASKELMYRDLITYTAGPTSYYAGKHFTDKFIKKSNIKSLNNINPKIRKAASVSSGMTLFMVWATYGAVKLAKKLAHTQKDANTVEKPENKFKRAEFKKFTHTEKFNTKSLKKTEETFEISVQKISSPINAFGKSMQNYRNSLSLKE